MFIFLEIINGGPVPEEENEIAQQVGLSLFTTMVGPYLTTFLDFSNLRIFLGSTFIQIGLLDDEYNWLSYELIPNKKGSQVIHNLIYKHLNKAGIKLFDIKVAFLVNGPGSHWDKGIEGVCQILELEDTEVF